MYFKNIKKVNIKSDLTCDGRYNAFGLKKKKKNLRLKISFLKLSKI